MLTYVGRQESGPLTAAQGKADAVDALRIAGTFGYSGKFPLCLDVEIGTFNSAPTKTVTYTKAWCATVKSAGARPGVYANPAPLKAMAQAKVPADFVWVASWLNHGPTPHDPHAIPQLPSEPWSKPGERHGSTGASSNGPARCGRTGTNSRASAAGHQQVATGRKGKAVARLVRPGSEERGSSSRGALLVQSKGAG